jgi:hypothetical protein
MAMRTWSEGRRRVWRWGWGALAAAIFFCPLGQVGSCSDAAGGAGEGQCTTHYVPIMGAVFGYSIPAP